MPPIQGEGTSANIVFLVTVLFPSFCLLEERNPETHDEEHEDDERESIYEDMDMDLEDSDFEPNSDRELLGLFFPEVSSSRVRKKGHYCENECDLGDASSTLKAKTRVFLRV